MKIAAVTSSASVTQKLSNQTLAILIASYKSASTKYFPATTNTMTSVQSTPAASPTFDRLGISLVKMFHSIEASTQPSGHLLKRTLEVYHRLYELAGNINQQEFLYRVIIAQYMRVLPLLWISTIAKSLTSLMISTLSTWKVSIALNNWDQPIINSLF